MRVAIIGDGIIGVAIAYFLKVSGADATLIGDLSRTSPSATDVSGGLLRVMDPDAALAHIALRGVLTFRNWEALGLPGNPGYTACGAVYLAKATAKAHCQNIAERLDCAQYPLSFLKQKELHRRFPGIKPPKNSTILFEPHGGYGSPKATRDALLDGYLNIGGAVVEATAQSIEKNIITHDAGVTHADVVIVATGAWTNALLSRSNIHCSATTTITPRTIAIPYFEDRDGKFAKQTFPVLVDLIRGTYLRPLCGGKFLIGAGNDGHIVDSTTRPALSQQHIADAHARGAQCVPALAQAAPSGGWLGIDGYTDSNRPVVGWVTNGRNTYLASGFSGRGYKLSLPIAAHVASEVLDRLGKRQHEITHRITTHKKAFAALVQRPERIKDPVADTENAEP
ncbi:MAG: FAD-dependent oxidoreductase [Pseudomonadota bacterium]